MSDDKYKDKDNFSSNSSWGFFHIEIPSWSGWDGRLENQVQQDDDGTQRVEGSVQGVGKQGKGNKYKTYTISINIIMTRVMEIRIQVQRADIRSWKTELKGNKV